MRCRPGMETTAIGISPPQVMSLASLRGGLMPRYRRRMSQTARFQETLRRLVIFHEGLVKAGFGADLTDTPSLDAKTVALLRVAASVAMGSSPVCLQWSAGRALAAGATKDEITDALLAIVPMAGLGRIVSAAPEVATALEYDVESALAEHDDH
jgi:4-carboxymuconolactone decarboxylase